MRTSVFPALDRILPRLVTVDQAARILDRGKARVRQLIAEGRLQCRRLGRADEQRATVLLLDRVEVEGLLSRPDQREKCKN